MKQSPVRYDPDAKCPLWEAAMDKWMCGDRSLVEYLQVGWGVPEELPRRCILAASRPGDVVMDVFAGSGTTGKTAMELGRRSVLIDINYTGDVNGYDELARQRFQQTLAGVSALEQKLVTADSPQQQLQSLCPTDLG